MKRMSAASIALTGLLGLAPVAPAQYTPKAIVTFDVAGDRLAFNGFPSHFEARYVVAVKDANGDGALDNLWWDAASRSTTRSFPGDAMTFATHVGSSAIRSTITPEAPGFCGGGASMIIGLMPVPRFDRTDWHIFWLAFHENPSGLGPGCSMYPIDGGIATWSDDYVTHVRSNFHAASLVGDSGTGFTQHGPILLGFDAAGSTAAPGIVASDDPASPAAILPGALPSITVGEFFGAGTAHRRFDILSIRIAAPYVRDTSWNGGFFTSDPTPDILPLPHQLSLPAGNGGNPAARRMLFTKGTADPMFGDNTILTPVNSQGTNRTCFVGGGESAMAYSSAPDGTGRLLVGGLGSAAVWALDNNGAVASRVRLAALPGSWATGYQQRESVGYVLWTRRQAAYATAELWAVDRAGVTLNRRTYLNFNTGFTAESFQILADGTAKLLWTDANGHAEVWTLDRALHFASRKAVTGPALNAAKSYDKLPDGTARILWSRDVNGSAYSVATLDAGDNVVGMSPETRIWTLMWARSLSVH